MAMQKIMNVVTGTATIGVNEGYAHKNENAVDLSALAELAKKIADEVEGEKGIYISGTIFESRTCYKDDWGCPQGGEATFVFTADCNPIFKGKDQSRETYEFFWKEAFILFVTRFKVALKQSTIFAKVGEDAFYLTND